MDLNKAAPSHIFYAMACRRFAPHLQ